MLRTARGLAVDAGDRFLWRFPPRRMEAEAIRDAILQSSGVLDLRMYGPGFSAFEPNDNYVRVYKPKEKWGPAEWRRMVYMNKVRREQDAVFGAFDAPDAGQVCPKRNRSTTPLQALGLLNSSFLVQQSGLLARRVEREAARDVDGRIRLAFQITLGRAPNAEEAAAGGKLVRRYGLESLCRGFTTATNSSRFLEQYFPLNAMSSSHVVSPVGLQLLDRRNFLRDGFGTLARSREAACWPTKTCLAPRRPATPARLPPPTARSARGFDPAPSVGGAAATLSGEGPPCSGDLLLWSVQPC